MAGNQGAKTCNSGINKEQIIRCFKNFSRLRRFSLHVAFQAKLEMERTEQRQPADFDSLQGRHQSAASDDCCLDMPATVVMAKPKRRKPSQRKAEEVEASRKTSQGGRAALQLAHTQTVKKVPSSTTWSVTQWRRFNASGPAYRQGRAV